VERNKTKNILNNNIENINKHWKSASKIDTSIYKKFDRLNFLLSVKGLTDNRKLDIDNEYFNSFLEEVKKSITNKNQTFSKKTNEISDIYLQLCIYEQYKNNINRLNHHELNLLFYKLNNLKKIKFYE